MNLLVLKRRLLLHTALAALVLLTGRPDSAEGAASTLYAWPTPQRIPEYYDMLRAPLLVADQNSTVYAFDLERSNGNDYTLMAREWTIASGWTAPVDVMLPPFMGVAPSLQDAFLGEDGVIRLIYFGGTQSEGNIFYTQAYAVEADRSQAWAEAIPAGINAGPVAAAAIGRVGDSGLVIAFAGDRHGQGLYVTHSLDQGETWSEPVGVARTGSSQESIASVSLETDDEGRVHLAWGTIDSSGKGIEFGYVRLSADAGRSEHAAILARADSDLEMVGEPAIISRGQNVYIVYEDGFPPTRWMRQSLDGGATWSQPVRPFPHVGGYGTAALLKDSAGQIHMVLGNRLPNPEIHGMWYSRLVDDQWLPLEPIISGPSTSSFDPCCPQAVVSQGNVLLATWPHNVRQEFLSGAWFSYALLDAPELPAVLNPVPEAMTADSGQAPEAPSASDTAGSTAAQAAPAEFSARPRPLGSPATAIFAGMIPVAAILAILFYDRVRRPPTRAVTPPEARDGHGPQDLNP